jgi:hypothetical protein
MTLGLDYGCDNTVRNARTKLILDVYHVGYYLLRMCLD